MHKEKWQNIKKLEEEYSQDDFLDEVNKRIIHAGSRDKEGFWNLYEDK